MKKKMLFWMLCLPLVFASCNNDDKNEKSEWQINNETAFDAIANNKDYKPITTSGGPGTIYVKVLKDGTGTERPISTARVKVLYKGKFYNEETFEDATTTPTYFPDETSTSIVNNGVVTGLSIALQNMVVGDKWEVWIPWDLGYGAAGKYDPYTQKQTFPGYATLVFELELLDFEQYPAGKK